MVRSSDGSETIEKAKDGGLTCWVLTAIHTPSPSPAIAIEYAKTWEPACTQTVPGMESRRIVTAPSGKKMTKARGMRIPCAMTIRSLIAFFPPSSSPTDEPPPEDAPLESDVLLALGPLLAPETAAVGAVPPAAVDVAVASWKGFTEFPPEALVRSNLNAPCMEWIWRLAAWSLVFKADPSLTDQIQLVDDDFRSMVPPFHELQFEPND